MRFNRRSRCALDHRVLESDSSWIIRNAWIEEMRMDLAYCEQIIRKNSYSPIGSAGDEISIGDMSLDEVCRRWVCHYKAESFVRAFAAGAPVSALTGFGMSGSPHVGTLYQIFNAISLQRRGIQVQLILGDIDAYCGKALPLNYVVDLAEKYAAFVAHVGFNKAAGSVVRAQYSSSVVSRTCLIAGKYMSDSMFESAEEDLHQLYSNRGKSDSSMTFRRKLSIALMTADILDLMLSENKDNVLVFLGMDEHKYVLFAEAVLEAMKLEGVIKNKGAKICALYSPLIRGFNGYPKMSKSFLESSINAESTWEEAKCLFDSDDSVSLPEDSVVLRMIEVVSDFSNAEVSSAREAFLTKGNHWSRWKRRYLDYLFGIFSQWKSS